MKRLYTVACCLFLLLGSAAQAQNLVWARASVSEKTSLAQRVATDAAGNVFITGDYLDTTITFGSVTLNNNGLHDVFLTKYDANGNVVWAVGFGGTASEEGYGVATDASGNCYLSGYFMSPTLTFGSITLTHASIYQNMFLAKLDPSGNVLWAVNATGPASGFPMDLSTDAAGNVCVAGYFEGGTLTLGSTSLSCSGGRDVFLAKYDPAGTLLWAKKAGGPGNDLGESVAVDPSGAICLYGRYSFTCVFSGTPLTSMGSLDAFVARYSDTGTLLWIKRISSTDMEFVGQIDTDGSGNIYCDGSFGVDSLHIGTTVLPTYGGFNDVFLCKFDPLGNLLWAKHGGGTDFDLAWGLAADPFGNVYIGGQYISPTFTFGTTDTIYYSPDSSYLSLFIAQFDPAGTLTCLSKVKDGGLHPSFAMDRENNLFIHTNYHTYPGYIVVAGDTFTNPYAATPMITMKLANAIHPITAFDATCGFNNGSILATVEGDSVSPFTYDWSPYGGTDSAAYNLAAGTYTLTVVDAEGCISMRSDSIRNGVPATVGVSGDVTIPAGDSTQLLATGSGTFNWSPAAGLSCTQCPDPVASPQQNTRYCVTLTDTNGCTAAACVEVTLDDCPVYVPNAFSPNGDGQNDLEFVRGACVRDLHFAVYDRWGTLVFETREQSRAWDGRYRGEMLEPAVFAYTLEATLQSGTVVRRSGNISLVR